MWGNTLNGLRGVRLRWIAKVVVGKGQPSKWKVETNFIKLQKKSQKDLIKSWCLLNQIGQSTTKVDSMELVSDEESAALQCQKAEPSG